MKIKNITIHNFRSVLDGQFNLDNYTLLVGENNAGKTTIISLKLKQQIKKVGLKLNLK